MTATWASSPSQSSAALRCSFPLLAPAKNRRELEFAIAAGDVAPEQSGTDNGAATMPPASDSNVHVLFLGVVGYDSTYCWGLGFRQNQKNEGRLGTKSCETPYPKGLRI